MAKIGEAIPVNPLVVRGTGHPSLGDAMEARAAGFEAKWTRATSASRPKLRGVDLIRRARKSEAMEIDVARFAAGICKVSNGRGLGSDATEAAMLKESPVAAQLTYLDIVRNVVAEVAWPVQTR